MLFRQAQVKLTELPKNWSVEAASFVNRLIRRKVTERMGRSGSDEVKSHPWFNGFDWKALLEKRMAAPFIPNVLLLLK